MTRRSSSLLSILTPHRTQRLTISVFQLFSFSAFFCTTLAPSLPAQSVIATDGDVPEIMGTAGSSGNLSQYIIGNTAAFDPSIESIQLGEITEYIQLIIRNGSTVTLSDNKFAYFFGSNNTLTVTGAESELFIDYDSSGGGIQILGFQSGNVLQVLDGGFVQTGRIAIYAQADGTFEIDGTGSTLQSLDDVSLQSSSVLNVSIGNGGLWDANSFASNGTITMNLNSGGTLRVRSALDVNNLDTFNFNSGATLQADSTLTNLGPIESGRSVDISGGGSFGSSTTLNGGTLETADFDMTNLVFTTGTIETTGALTNLNALSASQTVSLDGGNWAPSGNIDSGNTTIQSDGSLTVGDFNATNLTFTNGTVQTTGALTNLDTLSASQTVVLDGGTWAPSGNIDSGHTTIQGEGTLTVGDFSGTNLTFTHGTIESTGSLTNLGSIVSDQTVDISSGGSFGDATTLDGGTAQVDDFNLATGNLTFTSGTLDTSGPLTVGSDDNSQSLSGIISGTGDLTKSGTGTTTLAGTNTYSGTTTVSTGTLAVSAGASISHSSSNLRVGYVDGDDATLTIASGASVTNDLGTMGQASGSTGAIDVSGDWVNTGTLYVGNAGTGTLTIQTGAVVSNEDGRVAHASGSIGSVDVGGTWNNSGFTQIGRYGEGSLTIQTGGLVTNTDGALAAYTGTGTVDVSGTWTNSGELRVGVRGTGTLNLLAGGVLNAADVDGVIVGMNSGSVGTLNLGSGGNTGIVNAAQISGGSGTATLNFNHTDSDFHLTRDGTSGGTAVDLTGTLSVNHIGTGTSTLSGTNTYTGGTNITAGTLVASSLGTGTVTINGGSLSVTGAYDATNLTFTNGSLTIAGDASNLPDIVANNAVELTGGGTLQTATTLNGGVLTGGNFDLNSNLTFNSGTLNVSGTLQNLSHLPSGTAVNMSGASADLILSQDLVITGGTLNIDDGASVTVLNDVTLGAGVLGFDSNGGNLDLSGGTLNVASMDSTLTLNANASITGNGNIFGPVSLGVGGTIDGDATGLRIFGDVSGSGTLADTTLYGALNIGNSPGDVVLENATLTSSTIVALAIEGAANGEFDVLTIDAFSDISGATLNITFENYTPASMGLTYALVSNSSSTSFANVNTPDGWAFNGTTLSAVPEPTTFALLFGITALGFTATRRRRFLPTSDG